MMRTTWHVYGERTPGPTTAQIGVLFMKEYILPFEVASVFLLVALIGAAMIVRRKPE
jgi:NADH-quinone oxidoreductase subunit J